VARAVLGEQVVLAGPVAQVAQVEPAARVVQAAQVGGVSDRMTPACQQP
jgi:hypothetical protein